MKDKCLPMALRLFAAVVVLSCPSSCDAERSISVLNRIVTDMRGRMTWGNIRMHLIGAEDLKAEGYPFDEVARAWQGVKKRRRIKRKERQAPEEKGGKKRKGRANILLGEGEDDLSDLSDFGSDSGSSVSSLSSIDDSEGSSSSDGSGSGSGSGSDSASGSGSD